MTSPGPGCWSAPVAVFARRAWGSASRTLPTAGPWERVRAAGVSAAGALALAPVVFFGAMENDGTVDEDAKDDEDDDDAADDDAHEVTDNGCQCRNTSAPLPSALDVACRLY